MNQSKTVFVAGATGALGKRLCPLLIRQGWTVAGTTRYPEKAELLSQMGVTPVVADVFDESLLTRELEKIRPQMVIHQLTDLPFGLDPEKMEAALVRNARLREVGTQNLIRAATRSGAKRMIAQSIAFVYEPGPLPYDEQSPLLNFDDPAYGQTSRAVASLEHQVSNAPFEGIVLRYGLLYGPGTGFDQALPDFPPVHVDAAAMAACLAMGEVNTGIYNITEDNGMVNSQKAANSLGWNAGFRLE